MPSPQQLQRQLDSLGELRTIVKTMKALSAASIRQYEQAVEAVASYYRTVERGLHVVLRNLASVPQAPPRRREPAPLGAIVFGSDHGLCGRFNEEIVRYALEHLDSHPTSAEHRYVLAVGAHAGSRLEQEGQAAETVLLLPGSASQITATVQQMLIRIDEWREDATVQDVLLFYNRHSSRASYDPTVTKLLPVNLRRFRHLQEESWPSRSLPTFTMEPERLLQHLLRQYLFVSLFRACADSQASEHSSRLSAMQSAERNLDDRLEEVTMMFRRARQEAITTELLDVVAGFEVVMGAEHS